MHLGARIIQGGVSVGAPIALKHRWGWICLALSAATEEKGVRRRQAAPAARGAADLPPSASGARSGGAARRVWIQVEGPAGEVHGAGRQVAHNGGLQK